METSKTVKETTTVAPDPRKVTADDSTGDRNGLEPEAKRLKTLSTKDPSSAPEERPPLQARATSMDVPKDKSPLASPALPEKGWQCGFCTFINDLVLPYCEMCENPRGRAGEYSEGEGEREGWGSGVSEDHPSFQILLLQSVL